jgi:Domain of unknown function (DUF4365)
MDLNAQKEEFSYAYIHAIASAAGCTFGLASRQIDREGIDAFLSADRPGGIIEYPRLGLQVKCTAAHLVNGDRLHYPLHLKNYNELRKTSLLIPRLLVVVVVPENPEQWLTQSPTELCLHHCAYWISLRGEPETENKTTVTVYIPLDNIFSTNTLTQLMSQIATQGTL